MPNFNENIPKNKKIVLYTKAVDGMGDYAAALKLLPSLAKDPNIELTWIVKSNQPSVTRAVHDLEDSGKFPGLKVFQINDQPETMDPDQLLSLVPRDSDLIIVLPNLSYMDWWYQQMLGHCPKTRILAISEYDYNLMNKPSYSMGLGLDSLGVLIPDYTPSTMVIPKIQGIEDFNFEKPFFFGYSNNTHEQLTPAALLAYLNSIAVIAMKEGHDPLQIITNIPSNIIAKASLPNNVKIINPFPLSKDQFQNILYKSHPLTLCTGDQSLIENIFASKCVFYQVMKWKVGLATAFKDLVKETCGENSLYYQLISTAINKPDALPSMLQEQDWSNTELSQLTTQSKAIAASILRNKNFTPLFPFLVSLYLAHPEQRSTILKNCPNISISLLIKLLNEFEDEKYELLQNAEVFLPNIIRSTNDLNQLLNIFNPNAKDNKEFFFTLSEDISIELIINSLEKNLPNILKKGDKLMQVLYLVSKLPVTAKQNFWTGLQPIHIRAIIDDLDSIDQLLEVSKGLPVEQRALIIQALDLPPKIEINVRNFFQIRSVLSEVDDLSNEQIGKILEILEPQFEKIIIKNFHLKFILDLPPEQFSEKQRTRILQKLEDRIGSICRSSEDLQSLLDLPLCKLNESHRRILINAYQKNQVSEGQENEVIPADILSTSTPNVVEANQRLEACSLEDSSLIPNSTIEPVDLNTALEQSKTIKNEIQILEQQPQILELLKQYEEHLRKKLVKKGILTNYSEEINHLNLLEKASTNNLFKLIKRHETINSVYTQLKDKKSLDSRDIIGIKASVVFCVKNSPSWSERTFIQKLIDILSLGIKPALYHFFSKEKQFKNQIDKEIKEILSEPNKSSITKP